jgi:regulator of cell morphogenesis and NO signaling
MNPFLSQTLATIVNDNHQASLVFEKYNLDFCCKGKRTLEQACEENHINRSQILSELREATKQYSMKIDFQSMSLSTLADHIVRVHHTYIKIYLPQIQDYARKVSMKHGDRHPYMTKVFALVAQLLAEMDQHMKKEETELFPLIKKLEAGEVDEAGRKELTFNIYEHEHELAGALMEEIRVITHNYKVPEDACTTFRLCLTMLHAMELDLHQHVHLENNILFPKTAELIAEKSFHNQ